MDGPMTTTIRTECPCGAAYVSGVRRDPVLWGSWEAAHATHVPIRVQGEGRPISTPQIAPEPMEANA